MDISKLGGYSADSILSIEGAEKHRHAPARFLGSSSIVGIENQFFEIVDNSLDEIIAYSEILEAKNIKDFPLTMSITITENEEVIIEDNGRGIPCEPNKDGIPAIYLACEKDSAGGKNRGTTGYENSDSAGTHGAGMAVSKSCTRFFNLTVQSLSANGIYTLKYTDGERDGELTRIGDLKTYPNGFPISGTKIHYLYDDRIFTKTYQGYEEEEVYNFDRLDKRLSNMLVGQKANVTITFNYKNESPKIYKPSDYTPERLMGIPDDKLIKIYVEDQTIPTPYKAQIYFSFAEHPTDSGFTTIVNRLQMQSATIDDATLISLSSCFNGIMSDAYNNRRIQEIISISSDKLRRYVKVFIIFSLKGAEYSGQTKEKLQSEKYMDSFYIKMKKALNDQIQRVNDLFILPLYDAIIVDNRRIQELEKARKQREEYEKKAKEKEKKYKAEQKQLTDPIMYEKRRQESEIEIQTAPAEFYNNNVTLVYVEGKSAATELKDLHKIEGPQPFAIAAIEGKITNLYKDGELFKKSDLDQISKDNMNFCLNVGYKDIAIFTDADDDGVHIRLLLIAQILRLNPSYLNKGKVYIIPTPYSKIYINQKTTVNIFGEIKQYDVGTIYTYSRKEHEVLKTLPVSSVLEIYRGLADTTISTNRLLLDRENWIPVEKPTEKDIIILQKILKKRDVFKSAYTANLYTEREYNSKFLKRLNKYMELDRKNLGDLELDYMDEPNLSRSVIGGGLNLDE